MPSGTALAPDQHAHARDKIVKSSSGEQNFEAKKPVENLGTCDTGRGAENDHAAASQTND